MKNLILLAILSVLYGIVVLLANSGTKFFLIWFLAGGFFGALAALIATGFWMRLPAFLRGSLIGILVLGLVLFLIVEGLVLSGFGKKEESDLDYLIVLGAQVRKSGPTLSLKYRLDTAARYLEENPDTICIVSGGQGSNEPDSEAQVMHDYLVEKGISFERILMEDTSTNTMENIQNSSGFFDKATAHVGIVTNNFHVFRAIHLAKRQGYQHVSAISAPSTLLYLPNNMVREFFGILKDFVMGHLA